MIHGVCFGRDLRTDWHLSRETTGDVVLVARLGAALERLNPAPLPFSRQSPIFAIRE